MALLLPYLKHNNACGIATRETVKQAYLDALAGDPTSAFGGVLITNAKIDKAAAEEINSFFCEVVIAPAYDDDAVAYFRKRKTEYYLYRMRLNYLLNRFVHALMVF